MNRTLRRTLLPFAVAATTIPTFIAAQAPTITQFPALT